ncbi:MAG: hypothetical protein IT443_07740 [Phycisphaeraceae bacterium]|nr:hypothetical protein [Phycisphaeraceae bacterium]
MYRWIIRLAVLCLLPLVVLACDGGDAAERGRVQSALEQSAALFAEAAQGFVTNGPDNPDLNAFRQEKLQKAVGVLKPLRDQGAVGQRAAVNQMLAKANSALAIQTARQASSAWAELSIEAANVSTYVLDVHQAQNQAQVMGAVDESPLQTTLEEVNSKNRQDQAALEAKETQMAGMIQELEAQIAQVTSERDQALASATDLHAQAFVAKPPQQFELELAAIQSQRQAESFSTAFEKLNLQLSVLKQESGILQAQIQSLKQISAGLTTETAASREREKQYAQAHQKALGQTQISLEELTKQYQELANRFEKDVQPIFTQALEQADAAADAAASYRNLSKGDRQQARLVELATTVGQINVYSQYIMALGGYGRIADLLVAQTKGLSAEQSAIFQENATRIRQMQAELIEKTRALLEKSAETAGELAESGDEAVVGIANGQLGRLSNFNQRIIDSSL